MSMPGTVALGQVATDDPPLCGIPLTGTTDYNCLGRRVVDVRRDPVSNTRHSSSGSSSGIRYQPYWHLVSGGGPNGEVCRAVSYYPMAPAEDPRQPYFYGFELDPATASYPECPNQPGDPSQPESPVSYAIRFWQGARLPAPAPHIAPGRAITGKYAYLETHGATIHTLRQDDTPFGPLRVDAVGSYEVDWGDGTRTGPFAHEGGPWPDGKIVHEYLNVGRYDIVVTERWTATWTFGSESGALTELRTTGRIDDFPVEQIQAVRYR
jgi:hypothetical protein